MQLHTEILHSPKPYTLFWEQFALPRKAVKKDSLLLNFGNTAPLYGLKNQAVMIHDLAFMVHPEWFSKSFRLYYNTIIPIIAKRAKFIMTVSDFSKKEIMRLLKIPADKIIVLPLWADGIFDLESIKTINEDRDSFILSTAEPQQNYKSLMQAFSGLGIEALNLYKAGEPAKSPELAIYKRNPRISFLGRCSDEQLVYVHVGLQ